jgi:hypothetical protein
MNQAWADTERSCWIEHFALNIWPQVHMVTVTTIFP